MGEPNQPRTMFQNSTVDRFFRWPWWVVPLMWLPVAFYALWIGQKTVHSSLWVAFCGIFFGAFLWTLVEYVAHRFLLHHVGQSAKAKHIQYVAHGMHHAWPNEPDRVIIPPFTSALLGVLFAAMFFVIFPEQYFYSIFAGFILGYIWYECTHYAVHHVKWKFGLFKLIRRHHLLHHHSQSSKNKRFGVTTPLWDWVFFTLR